MPVANLPYIDEFRRQHAAESLARTIAQETGSKNLNFMEVCGTHTMAIFRSGLRTLLPPALRLVSGPGCPVCVTPKPFLDKAIELSRLPDTVIFTFGDLIRVPGSHSSLEKEKAGYGKVEIVYSPTQAVHFAVKNPDKQIVFLGVGFETTSPTIAASVLYAKRKGIRNFSVLSAMKLIPPALEFLASSEGLKLEGFLLPGHVSTIIGSAPYRIVADKHGIACVIGGFEPLDIMVSILMLVRQANRETSTVEIEYSRVVKPEGNQKAVSILKEVTEECDSEWRGLGNLPGSGLKLRKEFGDFDAEVLFRIPGVETVPDKGCICGDILKGLKTPIDCPLFSSSCTPLDPIGPCMVSSEGTCSTYYKYGGI